MRAKQANAPLTAASPVASPRFSERTSIENRTYQNHRPGAAGGGSAAGGGYFTPGRTGGLSDRNGLRTGRERAGRGRGKKNLCRKGTPLGQPPHHSCGKAGGRGAVRPHKPDLLPAGKSLYAGSADSHPAAQADRSACNHGRAGNGCRALSLTPGGTPPDCAVRIPRCGTLRKPLRQALPHLCRRCCARYGRQSGHDSGRRRERNRAGIHHRQGGRRGADASASRRHHL